MAVTNKLGLDYFDQNITIDQAIQLPTPKEVLADEDYKLVTEAFNTISKYRTPNGLCDISDTEMQSDLIYLQATLVNIVYRMGIIANSAETTAERVKIARAKVRVNGKSVKQSIESQGSTTTVTLDDIKELSYTKTENLWIDAENKRIAGEFVKFIYFAIKDHVAYLDKTIHRRIQIG